MARACSRPIAAKTAADGSGRATSVSIGRSSPSQCRRRRVPRLGREALLEPGAYFRHRLLGFVEHGLHAEEAMMDACVARDLNGHAGLSQEFAVILAFVAQDVQFGGD